MLDALKWLPLAKVMSNQALQNIPRFARQNSRKVNDGFFLTQSPAALAAAYFVHPSKAFDAMDYLRTVQVESLKSKDFVWNLPGEFRFIDVQDSAVLQPFPDSYSCTIYTNEQKSAFSAYRQQMDPDGLF